ncbi:MAG: hypothetical protein ACFE9Z_09495 [Promethearchaeota archaeon]
MKNMHCITDKIENPKEFIKKECKYISALLMGENAELNLSEEQIQNTLDKTFSFLNNDTIVFDFLL